MTIFKRKLPSLLVTARRNRTMRLSLKTQPFLPKLQSYS